MKALEMLTNCVNKEISAYGYTVLEFASRCGVSYGEMRKIVSGKATDVKLSTIEKICDNSHITLQDIANCGFDLQNLAKGIMLISNGHRYSISLKQYK